VARQALRSIATLAEHDASVTSELDEKPSVPTATAIFQARK
jgi:hypothetical protein